MIIGDTGARLKLNVLNSRIICPDDLLRITNYESQVEKKGAANMLLITHMILLGLMVRSDSEETEPPARKESQQGTQWCDDQRKQQQITLL